MIHPFLVIEIPLHRFFNPLLKLERWLPSQFLLQLSRVDGITHIMTLSISNVSYQIQVSTLRATEQSIHGLDNHLDDIDVLPLVETADVVSLGNLILVENHIDDTGMIYYIQPVAHVLTLTIYWQWLAMTDVIDEQMFITLLFPPFHRSLYSRSHVIVLVFRQSTTKDNFIFFISQSLILGIQ